MQGFTIIGIFFLQNEKNVLIKSLDYYYRYGKIKIKLKILMLQS